MKTPASTNTFVYTNPHPEGIKSLSDCVYRAISIATGKPWLDVYDELTTLGRKLLAPPNDKKTFSIYLDKIANRVNVMNNGKRLTGNDIAKLNRNKIYVVRMANHLAAVKGGKVRDLWNSGSKSAYIIWELQ